MRATLPPASRRTSRRSITPARRPEHASKVAVERYAVSHRFKTVAKACEVSTIRLHDLRHTAAAWPRGAFRQCT